MTDNFAEYPKSLGECRAEQQGCQNWTPREALINMLRDIDNGVIAPDALVCVARVRVDGDGTRTHFVNATPDVHTALGILTRAQYMLLEA